MTRNRFEDFGVRMEPEPELTDPRTAALAEVEAALRDVETLLHPGPARILRTEIARLREALKREAAMSMSMEAARNDALDQLAAYTDTINTMGDTIASLRRIEEAARGVIDERPYHGGQSALDALRAALKEGDEE